MINPIKKMVPFCFLTLSAFAAHAEINITNNTNMYGTTRLDGGSCSSNISGGIINPHSSTTIPGYIIAAKCWLSDCRATVYANKTCNNPAVAEITVSTSDGIKNVINLDAAHYNFQGHGSYLTINSAKRSFMEWIRSFF